MAAIDFPASPALNQIFVGGNNVSYKWNGTLWVAQAGGGASITVSDTPPVTPIAGAMWWNSVLGAMFIYFNDGNTSQWVPASPTAPNKLLQEVSVETGAVATGTTLLPADDTIPQITEGDQYMSLAITPQSATSKLVIEALWQGSFIAAGSYLITVALFQDATAGALAATWAPSPSSGAAISTSLRHVMTSGTTSATTFKIRVGGNTAGTTTFNGYNGGRVYGGVMASSIVIREIAP